MPPSACWRFRLGAHVLHVPSERQTRVPAHAMYEPMWSSWALHDWVRPGTPHGQPSPPSAHGIPGAVAVGIGTGTL